MQWTQPWRLDAREGVNYETQINSSSITRPVTILHLDGLAIAFAEGVGLMQPSESPMATYAVVLTSVFVSQRHEPTSSDLACQRRKDLRGFPRLDRRRSANLA